MAKRSVEEVMAALAAAPADELPFEDIRQNFWDDFMDEWGRIDDAGTVPAGQHLRDSVDSLISQAKAGELTPTEIKAKWKVLEDFSDTYHIDLYDKELTGRIPMEVKSVLGISYRSKPTTPTVTTTTPPVVPDVAPSAPTPKDSMAAATEPKRGEPVRTMTGKRVATQMTKKDARRRLTHYKSSPETAMAGLTSGEAQRIAEVLGRKPENVAKDLKKMVAPLLADLRNDPSVLAYLSESELELLASESRLSSPPLTPSSVRPPAFGEGSGMGLLEDAADSEIITARRGMDAAEDGLTAVAMAGAGGAPEAAAGVLAPASPRGARIRVREGAAPRSRLTGARGLEALRTGFGTKGGALPQRMWGKIKTVGAGKLGLGLGLGVAGAAFDAYSVYDLVDTVSGRGARIQEQQDKQSWQHQIEMEMAQARIAQAVEERTRILEQKDPNLLNLLRGLPELASGEVVVSAKPQDDNFHMLSALDAARMGQLEPQLPQRPQRPAAPSMAGTPNGLDVGMGY